MGVAGDSVGSSSRVARVARAPRGTRRIDVRGWSGHATGIVDIGTRDFGGTLAEGRFWGTVCVDPKCQK